jgi:cytoskeletal protein RodZ
VTRPNVLVGALAAVCVGTLLWCAWLILAADLTLGTSIAAWGLWLLVAAAAVTLVAYVRELGRHRHSVTSGGSWKPLPSLVLVWIGGLTAVGVFAFMLPSGAAENADSGPAAEGRQTGTPTTSATGSPVGATLTPDPRGTSSTASRSKPRTTPTTSPTAATATSPAGTPTGSPTSSPTSASRTSSTTTTPTKTKTPKPGITITLPHPH